jgi:UDP-GlcNAc:undecaprenyl-phosphate/decaprenyl-phosphate GlcNAc-1-phosphate transferase
VIRFQHLHAQFSADSDFEGTQKFHDHAVPRIGGLGVALAVGAALAIGFARDVLESEVIWLLLCAAPAFAVGVTEDLTKQVGVKARLAATMVSAALGYWLLGAQLTRVGIPAVDALLASVLPLAFVLTLVAVAGVANAINIIDGFNGLAAGTAAIMFAAFGFIAWEVGDSFLLHICIASTGALLGFAAWNWPKGHIFLGDGGAYLVGFLLAEVAVLLVVRNASVSPWFCLLVCMYPVTETVFSMYRRKVCKGWSPGAPDAQHLHSLIHRRLVRAISGVAVQGRALRARNAATAPYLWCLTGATAVPAVLFWQHPALLIASCLAFAVLYVVLYLLIVRFKTPRLLRRRVRA